MIILTNSFYLGESLPVTMYAKDSVKMGSTVVKGEVDATVEFTGGDTFFGKTASLLQVSAHVYLLFVLPSLFDYISFDIYHIIG